MKYICFQIGCFCIPIIKLDFHANDICIRSYKEAYTEYSMAQIYIKKWSSQFTNIYNLTSFWKYIVAIKGFL